MAFVLALDQGTTSSRAILFDRAGTVHAVAQREFAQLFPQPGWVEHDPMEIWASQSGVMAEVLAKAAIAPTDVAAIGITNQRETTVLWERATGRPVANAIVWQDRRTAPLCDALRAAGHETTFARKTGLVLDAYFSGTKLRWLLDHVAQARSRAERGEPGLAKNTYGTGCFLLLNTGRTAVTSKNHLLSTVAWRRDGTTDYALEGSVFIAGAVVQWLRDGLKIIRSAAEVEALAASVPDNGGVYLVPAFAGLGAPHWDAYARGAILGLTRGATGAHLARAALEAIAFQSAEVLRAMEADAELKLTELRVDGGATTNNLLMQFQADLLGVPVVRPKVAETTALGAAYLAGLAVGYWRDTGDVAANWQVGRRFEPAMSRDQAAALTVDWDKAVLRSKAWET